MKSFRNSVAEGVPFWLVVAGVLGGGGLLAQATPFVDFQRSLGRFTDESSQSLRSFRENYYNQTQPEDRPILERHLRELNKIYLRDPLVKWADPMSLSGQALSRYTEGVAAEFRGVRALLTQGGEASTAYQRCLKEQGGLNSLEDLAQTGPRFSRGVAVFADSLTRVSATRSSTPASPLASSTDLEASAQAIDKDWVAVLDACCHRVEGPASKSARALQLIRARCAQGRARMSELSKSLQSMQNFPAALTPPNPLEAGFSPSDLALMLANSRFRAQLETVRHSADNPQDMLAAEELYYSDLEQECRATQKRGRNHTNPFNLDDVSFRNLSQSLCSVGGALGTMSNLFVQRTTTALGRSFCNPAEMAAYDQSRDQAIQSLMTNIQSHANPPYLQLMRQLGPLTDPFPISLSPLGGYITPYGSIATRDSIGLGSPNALGVPLSRVSVGGRGSDGRRVAASRGIGGASGGTRGLAYGSAARRGVRSLSSQISRGRSTQQNAQELRSGAVSVRRLISGFVSGNRSLGSRQVRSQRAASAAQVGASVRQLAGLRTRRFAAQVGRTTSSGVLTSLRGRPRVSTGGSSPTGGTVQTLETLQANAETERKRLEGMARLIVDNMSYAKRKGAQVVQQIQLMIQQRDNVTQQTLAEVSTASPRKANDLTREMSQQHNAIDTQIALLKTEYDTYQTSLLEQGGQLQQLIVLGPEGAKYPSFGGQVTPNGFPKAPTAGRGSTSFWKAHSWLRKLWAGLDLVPDVIALNEAVTVGGGGYRSSREWAQAWLRYQSDYEKYVESQTNAEREAMQNLSKKIKERAQGIRLDSLSGYDTDVLITAEMHARALDEESGDLLERAKQRSGRGLNIDHPTLQALRSVQEEAQGALASLDELAGQYREFYPMTADENPEAWWALAGDLLLY